MPVPAPPPGMAWLADANGVLLTDADGELLYVPAGAAVASTAQPAALLIGL